ncbi:MAG: radical SAM family heme chaperone HemW [Oscillospiraceae bacterium]
MAYGLYVHIPYCHSRCLYCNFYTAAAAGVPEEYVDRLLQSFSLHAPKDEQGAPRRPQTVYFGGGTPSLLAPAQVKRLLRGFHPLPGAEITMEANPESATEEKLSGYRRAGVNRLSLGVQTIWDSSLARLGRAHTALQAQRAFRNARKAGFANISGDIMLALPGYSEQEFDDTLRFLQGEGAVHISAYLLKVEEGTPLAAALPPDIPGAEQAADFYLHAVESLAKIGYAQYEISNFAKAGFESRHNLLYWNCEDYLGIGPAAHSCLGGKRFSFAPNTEAFLQAGLPPRPEGVCSAEDYIMLRLRLAKGLAESELAARWGIVLSGRQKEFLHRLEKAGLATGAAGYWALTPEGMLVQNSVLAQLLA